MKSKAKVTKINQDYNKINTYKNTYILSYAKINY